MELTGIAPWDAATYYDLPQTTVVPPTGTGPVQIVKADATRLALILAPAGSGSVFVSTNPGVTDSTGYRLANGIVPWVLLFSDLGPLVQQAWYMSQGSGPALVTAVTVGTWPGQSEQSLIQQQDSGALKSSPFFKRPPPRPAKLFGNRWQFARGKSPYDIPYWE